LPGAEVERTVRNRKTLRRAHQRTAQMGVAIVVAPARVVCILAAGRRDLFQGTLEVRNRTRFELDGRDRQRRPTPGHVDDTLLHAALGDDAGYLRRNVDHLRVTLGRDTKEFLEYGHISRYAGVAHTASVPASRLRGPGASSRSSTMAWLA